MSPGRGAVRPCFQHHGNRDGGNSEATIVLSALRRAEEQLEALKSNGQLFNSSEDGQAQPLTRQTSETESDIDSALALSDSELVVGPESCQERCAILASASDTSSAVRQDIENDLRRALEQVRSEQTYISNQFAELDAAMKAQYATLQSDVYGIVTTLENLETSAFEMTSLQSSSTIEQGVSKADVEKMMMQAQSSIRLDMAAGMTDTSQLLLDTLKGELLPRQEQDMRELQSRIKLVQHDQANASKLASERSVAVDSGVADIRLKLNQFGEEYVSRGDFNQLSRWMKDQVDTMKQEMVSTFQTLMSEHNHSSASPSDAGVEQTKGCVRFRIPGASTPVSVDFQLQSLAKKLGELEQRLDGCESCSSIKPAAGVDLLETLVEKLLSGVLKMAQLLGVVGEDMYDKLGWRETCADLPRMMDHAWLRSRLPKRSSVLKLLRQKADSDHICELQTQLDDLASSLADLASRIPQQSYGAESITRGMRVRSSSPYVNRSTPVVHGSEYVVSRVPSCITPREAAPGSICTDRPPIVPVQQYRSQSRSGRTAPSPRMRNLRHSVTTLAQEAWSDTDADRGPDANFVDAQCPR